MFELSDITKERKSKMARRKIRNYPTRENVERLMNDYCEKHSNEIIGYMLDVTGYESVDELRDAEFSMRWPLDCGLVYITPKNREQSHEWYLDDDRISSRMFVDTPYHTQSTTLQMIQAEKILDTLGIRNDYTLNAWLD